MQQLDGAWTPAIAWKVSQAAGIDGQLVTGT